MKNTSLEATLYAAQSETSNLSVENSSLQKAFESLEASLRSYIHANQSLEEQIADLEMIRDDLNETCIILEQRMLKAEETVEFQKEDLGKLHETIVSKNAEIEELSMNIGNISDFLAIFVKSNFSLFFFFAEELETKCIDLEALVNLLEERHTKSEELFEETQNHFQKNVTKLEKKCSTLDRELGQVRNEKTDLIDMNENLSNQISEQLATIKKLQDKEQELVMKVDSSKRDLELAHNGMTEELYKHWEAEDELLNLQSVLDEREAELATVSQKLKQATENKKDMDSRFENISVNLVNAQADLEQKEEDIKNLTNELSKTNTLMEKLKLEAEGKKELTKKFNQTEKEAKKMKNNLEIRDEEISSLSLSLETQQVSQSSI